MKNEKSHVVEDTKKTFNSRIQRETFDNAEIFSTYLLTTNQGLERRTFCKEAKNLTLWGLKILFTR